MPAACSPVSAPDGFFIVVSISHLYIRNKCLI